MTISAILFMSCITVAAFLFFLARIMRWSTILRFSIPIDVTFSVIALTMSMGTWSGMAVAITSGLLLAVVLTVCKKVAQGSGAVSRRLQDGYKLYQEGRDNG